MEKEQYLATTTTNYNDMTNVFIKHKLIGVNYTFRGIHCWKTCDINQVRFLKNEHHHEFTINVEIAVNHDDRDIEFIMLQQVVEGIIHTSYPNYNTEPSYKNYIPYTANLIGNSCEMMCDLVINKLIELYGERRIIVSVCEDGHYYGKIEHIPFKDR